MAPLTARGGIWRSTARPTVCCRDSSQSLAAVDARRTYRYVFCGYARHVYVEEFTEPAATYLDEHRPSQPDAHRPARAGRASLPHRLALLRTRRR